MNGRERSGVGPSEVRAAPEVRCVCWILHSVRSVCFMFDCTHAKDHTYVCYVPTLVESTRLTYGLCTML